MCRGCVLFINPSVHVEILFFHSCAFVTCSRFFLNTCCLANNLRLVTVNRFLLLPYSSSTDPSDTISPPASLSLFINCPDTFYSSRPTRGCKFAWHIWQDPDQIFILLWKLCQAAPLLGGLLSCLMLPTHPYGIVLRRTFSAYLFPFHSSCILAVSV